MDKTRAITALSALGHETRLDAFRLLVAAGKTGMLAGDIAQRLSVRQNTLSSHLSILVQSGLAVNRRQGRAVEYRANMDGLAGLLGFLMQDCCGGHPEHCQPLIRDLASAN